MPLCSRYEENIAGLMTADRSGAEKYFVQYRWVWKLHAWKTRYAWNCVRVNLPTG